MVRLFTASIALASAVLLGGAARPSATAPASAPHIDPVGRVFQEWLSAFNSNDPAVLKTFYARYRDDPNPVFEIEDAEDSCGLTVNRIVERSPTAMTVLLRQRCLPGLQRATIELATADGAKLKTLEIAPLTLAGDEAVAAVADIATRLAKRDGFAGSLVVARGDTTLLARSWGLADPAAETAMTLDTPMFLASAGKMFTGVAVLQLADAGKIDLDAPLGRYLTNYVNREMAKVTIRQLLTHRGGSGDIGILGRDDGANRVKVRTIGDIIALNGARGPDFPPGSRADYSNYGFILLGAVIEKVTGESYYDYVAEHVFRPAGMTHAGFPDRDHLRGVAVGYTRFFGAEAKLAANLDVLPWRGASAGGGVASPNDMRRFFVALRAGRLLTPAMLALATTPGATPWYGMGFIAQAGNRPSWGHGGNSYGMDVALHTYPEADLTFICMAARDSVCNRLIYAYILRAMGPSK